MELKQQREEINEREMVSITLLLPVSAGIE